jgi:1,4-dihydroxy-2-naphthoate octaprenyltransferase
MITGAYFVYSGTVTLASVLVAIPIGCLVALILHANNIRDIGPDRVAGKRTLATILGRHGANIEFLVLILGAYGSIVSMVAVVPMTWPALLTLVTFPKAVQITRRAWKEADLQALNHVVRDTAQLHFRFGMLLTIGLLLTVLGERFS